MWIRTAVLLAISLGSAVAYGDEYSVTPASSASSAAAPGAMDMGNHKNKCQEKWKKYYESQACFAPCRLASGGIKAEAFKHCKEVKQPELCE